MGVALYYQCVHCEVECGSWKSYSKKSRQRMCLRLLRMLMEVHAHRCRVLLQCVAVQCVAVQCVAVQCVAVQCGAVQCVAVKVARKDARTTHTDADRGMCTPLQCVVAACCSVSHCSMLKWKSPPRMRSRLWWCWLRYMHTVAAFCCSVLQHVKVFCSKNDCQGWCQDSHAPNAWVCACASRQCVMLHMGIWMSPSETHTYGCHIVRHTPCDIRVPIDTSSRYQCVMFHIWMCQCAKLHIWMCLRDISASCCTYECVFALMNLSCQTCGYMCKMSVRHVAHGHMDVTYSETHTPSDIHIPIDTSSRYTFICDIHMPMCTVWCCTWAYACHTVWHIHMHTTVSCCTWAYGCHTVWHIHMHTTQCETHTPSDIRIPIDTSSRYHCVILHMAYERDIVWHTLQVISVCLSTWTLSLEM